MTTAARDYRASKLTGGHRLHATEICTGTGRRSSGMRDFLQIDDNVLVVVLLMVWLVLLLLEKMLLLVTVLLHRCQRRW